MLSQFNSEASLQSLATLRGDFADIWDIRQEWEAVIMGEEAMVMEGEAVVMVGEARSNVLAMGKNQVRLKWWGIIEASIIAVNVVVGGRVFTFF